MRSFGSPLQEGSPLRVFCHDIGLAVQLRPSQPKSDGGSRVAVFHSAGCAVLAELRPSQMERA